MVYRNNNQLGAEREENVCEVFYIDGERGEGGGRGKMQAIYNICRVIFI